MPTAVDELVLQSLTVRGYTDADWMSVCRIHDVVRLQELAAGGVDPLAFRTMSAVAEADEFFESQTVVACLNVAVAGFISWNAAYITWMYVEPTLQRHGIGWRLLQHAVRQIGPEAWTNMIAGNEPALCFIAGPGSRSSPRGAAIVRVIRVMQ